MPWPPPQVDQKKYPGMDMELKDLARVNQILNQYNDRQELINERNLKLKKEYLKIDDRLDYSIKVTVIGIFPFPIGIFVSLLSGNIAYLIIGILASVVTLLFSQLIWSLARRKYFKLQKEYNDLKVLKSEQEETLDELVKLWPSASILRKYQSKF